MYYSYFERERERERDVGFKLHLVKQCYANQYFLIGCEF